MTKIIRSGVEYNGIEIVCLYCQQTFIDRQKGKETKKFCNINCANEFKNQKLRAKWSDKICDFCQQPFKRRRKTTTKTNTYFCCRKCKDAAQSLDTECAVKPKHYGTGAVGLANKFYLENCKTGCVTCSETRPYLLQVHHIDGDRTNNKIDNFELVCANCHIIRHLKFQNGEWILRYDQLTPRDVINQL